MAAQCFLICRGVRCRKLTTFMSSRLAYLSGVKPSFSPEFYNRVKDLSLTLTLTHNTSTQLSILIKQLAAGYKLGLTVCSVVLQPPKYSFTNFKESSGRGQLLK